MGQNISESFNCPVRLSTQKHPDSIALFDRHRTLTYAQLDKAIESSIDSLVKFGVKPGDTVALLGRNSLAYTILFFAALRCGYRLLLLNCRMRASDWGEQISKSDASFLIYDREFATESVSFDIGKVAIEDFLLSEPSKSVSSETRKYSLNREALVIYTSGSNGHPRGVVLNCGNLYYSALGCIEALALNEDDIWLGVLPFFHVGGISIILRTALVGCAAYVMEKFDADEIISLCREQRVTVMSVVPTMLRELLEKDKQNHLCHTKAIIVGGAAFDSALRDEAVRRGWPILTTYGLTETSSMMTLLGRNDLPDQLSTAGKLLPYRELSIVDETGQPLPNGQIGHIRVRGATRFNRYLNPDNSPFDADGWFPTGDKGWFDEKGYLTVIGRVDRTIVSGGENIDLDYLEQSLISIKGVKGAVVVARPDRKWGHRPVAFVEVRDEKVSEDKLKKALLSKLPAFMLPDSVTIVPALPKTANGKYDRLKVVQQYRNIMEPKV